MSAEVEQFEQPHVEEHHPGVREYAEIATILTVVTAVEVALFFITGVSRLTLVMMLSVLMVLKFGIVIGWYMHLKFDHHYFTYIFIGGLLMSASVMIAIMAMFGVFDGTNTVDLIRGTPTP